MVYVANVIWIPHGTDMGIFESHMYAINIDVIWLCYCGIY